ncbi:cyclic GMP-AMP synthase DncV-like nucleotidyltransferase [Aeromonas veronii]|uniref:nucleotidyltransferase domain-containing protein n=1 Tax=Aeromonas veronii TaxID=654 RepID=UPI00191D430F|nr:nucleotidyltransferase [Aeromonas veronii]MBL0492947.1 nucleotidyltransferase [Aeromonas veronii]
MPAVQKQFEDFHTAIKLDDDDEKAKLRDKRKVLIDALRAKLDDDVPSFEAFNQGSYAMHTGVVPLDGNYDIDVGVIFDCNQGKYPDPVVLKKKVHDALDSHGRTVLIRRPCVTVNYMRDNLPEYHVDLVIYTKNDDGLLAIGKGKEHSAPDLCFWEPADPKKLTELICDAFTGQKEREQYRRCIRYLKRWRDVQFRNGGAPLSIALTVAAKQWFKPTLEASGKPTDLLALFAWVTSILNQFQTVATDEGHYERLKVNLPVTPGGDLMERMSKLQMETFKAKLKALKDALDEAYSEDLPEDACKILKKQFGDDFKVPEKAETAKATVAPVISTGNSA